jgi:XTP/dITP diphosphohydrolase
MPRRRFLLATRSTDKLREIREILAPVEVEIVSLAELGVAPAPEEDALEVFETFRENALAKARYFAALTGVPTLADDSGLEVDALDRAPGVYTKRFSGRTDLAGKALDQANNDLLLEKLRGIPDDRRGARYVCAAVVAQPDGRSAAAIGTTSGRIGHTPSQGTGGFGYDPLFFVPELGATFADVSAEDKHARSHRSRAFRALAPNLKDFA